MKRLLLEDGIKIPIIFNGVDNPLKQSFVSCRSIVWRNISIDVWTIATVRLLIKNKQLFEKITKAYEQIGDETNTYK